MNSISENTINKTIESIQIKNPNADSEMITRGVNQTAQFWETSDGSEQEFTTFCTINYIADSINRKALFERLQRNYEILIGNYNKLSLELKLPIQVMGEDITNIDELFGAIDPLAHFNDDMFSTKIAFLTMLNFPFYTLEEKNKFGKIWNRQQWAYARMGDMFTSRIPSDIVQAISNALTDADNYISNYNIIMDNVQNEEGISLFPADMKLISHWGLRDELKSDYADSNNGFEKQCMIYGIMKHIVNQTIPQQVIDNEAYIWKPISNQIYRNNSAEEVICEPDTRYQKILNIYHAQLQADIYNPTYSTYILRAFEQQMEVSYDEIEKLFIQLISAPQVAQTAHLIKNRLGRELKPFDIWYDGFKSRSNILENDLSKKTQALYPNAVAFEKDMPHLLQKLGFTPEKANFISSKVVVDASRGAGHAWGAGMRSEKSHLRTKISKEGMDYKGYNIATHEFGHNVEQTITLHEVDNYIMNGVPSTAFTEALAFVFQKRDLELLGYDENDKNKASLKYLDIFWGCYEIMGISLVDMRSWKWLYEHPEATATELKTAIIHNAQDIWNQYYAPILGETNSPILAIYSHMIDYSLYLPNYPYGHLIEFQLEKQFVGKNIATEIQRIYPIGRVTPNYWMQHAVGSAVSVEPLLEAVNQALELINK